MKATEYSLRELIVALGLSTETTADLVHDALHDMLMATTVLDDDEGAHQFTDMLKLAQIAEERTKGYKPNEAYLYGCMLGEYYTNLVFTRKAVRITQKQHYGLLMAFVKLLVDDRCPEAVSDTLVALKGGLGQLEGDHDSLIEFDPEAIFTHYNQKLGEYGKQAKWAGSTDEELSSNPEGRPGSNRG